MRLLILISLLALASCGHKAADLAGLDALDLEPCGGWIGETPRDNAALLNAAAAEKFGRLCNESKLKAARDFRETMRANRVQLP